MSTFAIEQIENLYDPYDPYSRIAETISRHQHLPSCLSSPKTSLATAAFAEVDPYLRNCMAPVLNHIETGLQAQVDLLLLSKAILLLVRELRTKDWK